MATPKDELNFSEDFEIRDELLQQLLHRIRESDPDTRAALSDYTLDADEHQTNVIHAVGKVLRLVAPAGSGKTQSESALRAARAALPGGRWGIAGEDFPPERLVQRGAGDRPAFSASGW